MPASPGIGMHVEVTDPDKKILLSKYYSSEGRFTFTSHTPGEHTICLHSNSTKWSLFAGGKLVSIHPNYTRESLKIILSLFGCCRGALA